MKCCLWLNGVKVWHTRDIKNNFDLASLRGYFMGGSLSRWLTANGGEEEAKKLEETGDIEYTFGISEQLTVNNEQLYEKLEIPAIISMSVLSRHGSYNLGSGGSFGSSGSFGSGSGLLGYGLHII